MPYYRILVWTKKQIKPFTSIKWVPYLGIAAFQDLASKTAIKHFYSKFIDCEVQMLDKASTAIKKFLALKEKKD